MIEQKIKIKMRYIIQYQDYHKETWDDDPAFHPNLDLADLKEGLQRYRKPGVSYRIIKRETIITEEVVYARETKTASEEEEKRSEIKEGQYCYALDCIHHPLHETWKKEGKSIVETIQDHNKEAGCIRCMREIYIGSAHGAGCSEFETEKKGRKCSSLDCIFHPQHKTWKASGKPVWELVEEHDGDAGYLLCDRDVKFKKGRCPDFKTEH